MALVGTGVLERELHDAARSEDADVLDRDRGVGADLHLRRLLDDGADLRELGRADVEFDARVEVLDVLAHDDEIDVPHRRLHAGIGLGRPQVGVEVEFLAKGDVHRAHAGAELGRKRAFEPDLVTADRVEGRLRERIAELLERGQTDIVDVPVDLNTGRFDGPSRGLDDLRPGAVAGNEGDAVRHSGPSPIDAVAPASYARSGAIEQPVGTWSTIEIVYS